MSREHRYEVGLRWTGNGGEGTKSYAAYSRDHVITCNGKAAIDGSSDPAFRGNPSRHNPEELFLGSISACHMLWYLHLCAVNGVIFEEYEDSATGVLVLEKDGSGAFAWVKLAPRITIREGSDKEKALALHGDAHRCCFIANSIRVPVEIAPEIKSSVGA